MKHIIFTEKELENVFSGKRAKKEKAKIFHIFKTFGIFISITAVIFVLFNYQQLYKNLNYWYESNYSKADKQQTQNSADQILNELIQQDKQKPASSLPPLPELVENHLTIPAIDVDAPITWNVANTPEETLANLKNGLIHVSGTALPGEKGNVFISGHSSNYPWVKSAYNNVFALLNKVAVGDYVQLKYSGSDFLYKISDIKIVKPDDSSVMQSGSSSVLTLMTCTPVGTNLKRLIVTANQIYPSPNNNTKASSTSNLKMPKKVR